MKENTLFPTAGAMPFDCVESIPVPGHEPSLLPAGRNFKLVWSDEFDGDELDRTKWAFRTCMMQKRHPAWTDTAVRLDGKGNAVFDIAGQGVQAVKPGDIYFIVT